MNTDHTATTKNDMQVKSCFSTNIDPYRAGIEIGEELAAIHPEVIFLFPTIHYNGSPELVEAIYDVLESDDTVLIGNTGDGFYERHKVAGAGVAALGMNSGGAVRWHVAYESDVGKTPFDAAAHCLTRLNATCSASEAALYFLASDFRTDASELIAALQETVTVPVVGGLAGDDYAFKHCFVYVNRMVLTDSIAILAVDGAISYDIRVAHTLQPVGRPGEITDSENTLIRTIDNIPAMDFITRELGKPLDVVDEGNITFKLMEQEHDGRHRIRSLLLPGDGEQHSGVKLFGGVEQGNHVQVCLAPPDKIIQDVRDIGNSLDNLPFKPVAALIVSCAGRKKILADDIEYEVQEIVRSCQSLEALAGYPSFGEFGPVKHAAGYSRALFHNMTFILLLIGGTGK